MTTTIYGAVLPTDERRMASYPEHSNNHPPLRILEKQNMTFKNAYNHALKPNALSNQLTNNA